MPEPSRSLVRNVLRGGALVLACLAMFETPAAYVASRGWSPWLSLAVGLLAFPVLALVWHALAERKRAKAPPAKPMTKGWERWLMRSAVVGVLLVGVLIAVAGGGRVLRGLRYHALWFLPEESAPLVATSKTFDHIPPSTEALVWVRLDDDTRAALSDALPKSDQLARALATSDFVVAAGRNGLLLAERGDSEAIAFVTELLADLDELAKQYAPGVEIPKGERSETHDGTRYLISSSWKAELSKGRPEKLLSLIGRAPSDASIVAIALGVSANELDLNARDLAAVIGYMRVHRGRLEAAAALDFSSKQGAEEALAEARKGIAAADKNACWRRYGRIDAASHEATSSAAGPGRAATVELTASVSLADLRALVECATK